MIRPLFQEAISYSNFFQHMTLKYDFLPIARNGYCFNDSNDSNDSNDIL